MNWRQRTALVLVTGLVLGLVSGALTRDIFANSSVEYTGPGMGGGGSTVTTASPITGDGSGGSPVDLLFNNPFADSSGLSLTYNGANFTLDGSGRLDILTGGINNNDLNPSALFINAAFFTGNAVTTELRINNSAISTTELQDNSVTLAKMEDLATQRLIGRYDAGTGDPQGVGIGTGLLLPATGNLQLFQPIQAGGNAFADIQTLNFVNAELTRSAGVLSVTNKVSATDEGAAGQSITTVNVSGLQAEMGVSGDVGTISVTPTTFQNSGGSNVGSFPYVRLGSGFTIGTSQPDVIDINVPAPSSTVSTQSPITGDGSGGSPVGIGLDASLKDVGGSLTLNGPVTVGGNAFSNFKTLNLVGFTVSRSADVTTVTNSVSTSGDITGDGSEATPVTYTNPFTAIQQGGNAFASGIRTINWVGEELSRSGTVLTVTSKVSVTGDLSGDGSAGSPITYTNPALAIQQGGNAFASGILTVNYVGEELTRSGSVLTVTSKVSASSPLSGVGSAASPLDVGLDSSIQDVSGSLTLNGPVTVGGNAFANFRTLNLVGFEVTRSADVLTVTNKISATDEGASGASIDTVNVSSRMANMSVSSNVGTVNITPTTYMAGGGGIVLGQSDYVSFGSGLTATMDQAGIVCVSTSSSSTENFEGAMFGGLVLWDDTDSVSLTKKMVVRNDADDGWIEIPADTECVLTAGSDANGSDTDSANTWYYLYAIATNAAGSSPALYIADDNVAGGGTLTFPTGYSGGRKRQLCVAFRNDGSSNLYKFVTAEGWPYKPRIEFTSDMDGASATQVVNDAGNTANTGVDISTFVPPISNIAIIRLSAKQREVYVLNQTPGGYYNRRNNSNGNNTGGSYEATVYLNSSKTLIYGQNDATGAADIDVVGFIVTEVP